MLSISVSLVAVFIPLLFMEGQVGRLFREFAVTLSAAVLISLVDLADDHADDVRLAAALEARGQGARRSRPVGSRVGPRPATPGC